MYYLLKRRHIRWRRFKIIVPAHFMKKIRFVPLFFLFMSFIPVHSRQIIPPDVDGDFHFIIVIKEKIISACDKALKQNNLPIIVKNEIIRTKTRLLEGPNNPILP